MSVPIVERAFQIANEGRCLSVEDIRKQLRRERYAFVDASTAGRLIKEQLIVAITDARLGPA